MKILYPLVVLLSVSVPSCLAQFHVETGDGRDVTIGPNGINVTGGGRKHVQINSSGSIHVDNGAGHRVRIGGPSRTKVTTTTSSTARVRSATSTTTTVSMPLAAQVTIIERQVYGSTSEGMPLAARVDKLEQDNLGRKGTGSLSVRVTSLARELGVNLSASGRTTTTVTTTSPGATSKTVLIGSPGTVVTEGDTSVNLGGLLGGINSALAGTATNATNAISISGAGQTQTIATSGQPVRVDGSSNSVRISGACPSLSVHGAGNTVWVDTVDAITVDGMGNRVFWNRAISTTQPIIRNEGMNNQVTQGFSK